MDRLPALQKKLPEKTAAVILTEINRFYFTGFRSSAGALFLTNDTSILFVDGRYFEAASESVDSCKTILQENLFEQINAVILNENIKKLFTESEISIKTFQHLFESIHNTEVISGELISNTINEIRSVKTPDELAKIKDSQKITEKGFYHILDFIKPGRTESEIALELEFFLRKNGAEAAAFDFIVVSGENSSKPHGVPTEKALKPGELITLDFGSVFEGYCSDMTRTVALGEVSEKQREIYEIVKTAGEMAISEAKPGIPASRIDFTARRHIENSGYGNEFCHSTGHGIGLEVHETLSISRNSEQLLKPGNVFTVEPGIYLPHEFGVRIEDAIFITQDGCVNITEVDRNLIIL